MGNPSRDHRDRPRLREHRPTVLHPKPSVDEKRQAVIGM